MLLSKLKTVSLALLLVVGISGSALAWARRTSESPIKGAQSGAPTAAGATRSTPAPLAGGFPSTALNNAPNLAAFGDPIPIFGTGAILVVETPDGRALEARSVDSEDLAWHKLPIPPGIRVTPVAAEDTVALAYQGESIKQLAAFSAHTGDWSTVELAVPIQEAITPVVGPGSALYQAGNDFYAFSSEKGAWDVLRLPAGTSQREKPRSSLSLKYISVQHGDRIYVFSLKHGKWSQGATMKLPAAKKEAPSPSSTPTP
jgi:hypothetical protein